MAFSSGLWPSAFVGGGYGLPVAAVDTPKPDPTKEYVAGGFGVLQPAIPQVLPITIDDVTRDFGPTVYDIMMTDPRVWGAVNYIKLGILSGGFKLAPVMKRKPWEGNKSVPDEVLLSEEVCEFCQHNLDRMGRSPESVSHELLDCMPFGNILAEKVCEYEEQGEYAGDLVLKAVKPKPRWSWQFVVDPWLNTLGILAYVPGGGSWQIIPREKFAVISWMVWNGDPRGRSMLRAAYFAWNMKMQIWPQYYGYLVGHAGGKVLGFTAPSETADVIPTDSSGKQIAGAQPISPQQNQVNVLKAWGNNFIASFPAESKIEIPFPPGNGEAFIKAIDLFDRQTLAAIIHNPRTLMEAEHGSKADSGDATDATGTIIHYGRDLLCEVWRRDVLHELVEAKWGKPIADAHTPKPSLGVTEHRDQAPKWTAYANMVRSGVPLTQSQHVNLQSDMGIPPPEPGEEIPKPLSAVEMGGGGGGPTNPEIPSEPAGPVHEIDEQSGDVIDAGKAGEVKDEKKPKKGAA